MRKAVDRVHTQEVILGSVQGALALTAKEKILSFTTLFLQLKGLLSLVRAESRLNRGRYEVDDSQNSDSGK